MSEAPDIRELEDCPGPEVCNRACDQHEPCPGCPMPDERAECCHDEGASE